jgi:hypothetical protein
MGCAESRPDHLDHGLAEKTSKQTWAKAVLGLSGDDLLVKCFAGWVRFVVLEKKARAEREAINAKIKAKEKASPHDGATSFRGTFATKSIFAKEKHKHHIDRVGASKSTVERVNGFITDRRESIRIRREAVAKKSWAKLRVVARFGGLQNVVNQRERMDHNQSQTTGDVDSTADQSRQSRNSYRRPSDGTGAVTEEGSSPMKPGFGIPKPVEQSRTGEDLDELSTWTMPGDDSADSASPTTPAATPPATAAAPAAAPTTAAPSTAAARAATAAPTNTPPAPLPAPWSSDGTKPVGALGGQQPQPQSPKAKPANV